MHSRQANPAILLCLACAAAPVLSQSATPASLAPVPIAIVLTSGSATVTGALQVTAGKAILATAGTITSGAESTQVTLPRRGTLRICASTTVKLTSDTTVPAGETPGLMLALDRGAIETSFATGHSADVLLTPDFRILIGGPGAAELKVRLGHHGDTCVENGVAAPASTPSGLNPASAAPYVIVSSAFEGGAYRVQPGQRVMFQHGSLREVVDNEKEPCGCPPDAKPAANDFPLAQSAGLTPNSPPVIEAPPKASPSVNPSPSPNPVDAPLAYNASQQPEPPSGPQYVSDPKVAQPTGAPAAVPAKKNFFHKIGGFFRKIFGAE